jgi:hypothetical protein
VVDAIALKATGFCDGLIQPLLQCSLKFGLFAGKNSTVDEFKNHKGFVNVKNGRILPFAIRVQGIVAQFGFSVIYAFRKKLLTSMSL